MNSCASPSEKRVRIGGASGFWGDSSIAAPQLAGSGQVDYLVFDYLAELTMSILAGARLKKPELGYATDFIAPAMQSVLQTVVERGIRVVSNAGGVNPQGCADALRALAREQGIALKIAVVLGDDVMPLLPALREGQPAVAELQSGKPLPAQVLTANAYLGALPIKAALDAGAQVVITGRCVDSAVTLGILMHEFGWTPQDHDRLAGGSLAGHILECGCQATGGLHTDWDQVPGWANMGYPIVECAADGSFTATKPAGTGGLVNPAVIGEQVLYEIHDPQNYLLPDVICDFSQVRLTQVGENRVHVQGAKGRAPTPTYKVCATYVDGFKTSAQLSIVGFDAAAKARRTAAAILERTRAMLDARGLGDYTATHVEVLGTEACYGPHASRHPLREAVMRLTVTHRKKEALMLFAREVAPAGTSWAPGTTGSGTGRASVAPSIRQYAFLLPKQQVSPSVQIEDSVQEIVIPAGQPLSAAPVVAAAAMPTAGTPAASWDTECQEVPLIRLAFARSGDKGDVSNIGVIARRAKWVDFLRAELTTERVRAYLAHLVQGQVTRYELPGFDAFNFVCEEALGGGGMSSMRNDPLGKGMGQILLSMPMRVPSHLLAPD